MNIFVFNADPVLAARDHCDRHVVKMTLEAAQMISTVQREFGGHDLDERGAYRSTHRSHPCTLWASASSENYRWLHRYGTALAFFYEKRFFRSHASSRVLEAFHDPPPGIPQGRLTPFAQAMPEQYRGPDAVHAYRRYFAAEKRHLATWRDGPPTWWVSYERRRER